MMKSMANRALRQSWSPQAKRRGSFFLDGFSYLFFATMMFFFSGLQDQ